MRVLGVAFFLWAVGQFHAQEEGVRQAELLIEKLRSDKPEEREEAFRKLKIMGRTAVPVLEKAVTDKDAEVVVRAQSLLRFVRIQDQLAPRIKEVIPDAVERLASGDDAAWTAIFKEVLRLNASGQLRELNKKDVEYLVAPALRGARTVEEKTELCKLVSAGAYRAAVYELIRFLEDDVETVREHSSVALQVMDVQEFVSDIQKLLSHSKATSRAWAARTLGRLGAKQAIPGITFLINDSCALVRAESIQALELLEAREAAVKVQGLLGDNDANVRKFAVSALGAFQAKDEVPRIAELLRDPDASVRGAAATALAWLRSNQRAPEIAVLLRDGNDGTRVSAAVSLVMLGSEEHIPQIVGLLKDKDAGVRGRVGIVLENLEIYDSLSRANCREAALPSLSGLMKDAEPTIRARAAEILGILGAKNKAGDISTLLLDEDASVRLAAANSLCWLSRKEGVVALLAMAKENPEVRLNCLNAIRRTDLWHRLQTTKVYFPPQFTQANLRDLVRKYGWNLRSESEIVVVGSRDTTLLGLLEHLGGADAGAQYILEEQEIRLVQREQAFGFWTEWWKSQSDKK